jgi:hypothetical protein
MRCRRLLLGAGVLALLGLVVLFLTPRLQPVPPPGASRENFHRLYLGMPRREVEALFGGPGLPPFTLAGIPDMHTQSWANRQKDRGVVVSYGADWRVVSAVYIDRGEIEEKLPSLAGPLARLRRLLGW